MHPMRRLAKATIDQVKEFLSSHGILTGNPGESIVGWSVSAVKPDSDDRLLITSRPDNWPIINIDMVGPIRGRRKYGHIDISETDLGVLLRMYELL